MPALERVRVAVARDSSTTINLDVFAYELAILAKIHGPEALNEESSTTVRQDWNAQEAHEALRRKYGDGLTAAIYPTVQSLARAVEPKKGKSEEV